MTNENSLQRAMANVDAEDKLVAQIGETAKARIDTINRHASPLGGVGKVVSGGNPMASTGSLPTLSGHIANMLALVPDLEGIEDRTREICLMLKGTCDEPSTPARPPEAVPIGAALPEIERLDRDVREARGRIWRILDEIRGAIG